ncbi:hypothetical protein M011DRAFT_264936 [Sporormia fimetaria CBS 119925]|uniref:Uncharacterized protein n=1 Tax=Sporormia fimetaria CBS 119925 TaxID=1340428 RepID=A0A6A6UWA4_9PLEO|nr:hypothetical protein M011DRAFT_264936 [Sporormia fimetaria CBS 119925]
MQIRHRSQRESRNVIGHQRRDTESSLPCTIDSDIDTCPSSQTPRGMHVSGPLRILVGNLLEDFSSSRFRCGNSVFGRTLRVNVGQKSTSKSDDNLMDARGLLKATLNA